MLKTNLSLRIHPTIGFARLGTSEGYYLAPDTSAGLPEPGTSTVGGLPIRPGTESETITSKDLRDEEGQLKRQAARFRLFAYDLDGSDSYPNGGGVEVRIGSVVGGKTVTNITWTVHLANKKPNAYMVVTSLGVKAYEGGKLPGTRNAFYYGTPDAPTRLSALVIDPGPRAIAGKSQGPVEMKKATVASFGDDRGQIEELPDYPQSFPADSQGKGFEPLGPLDTLGQILTDEHGRLLVLGGYGRTFGVINEYGKTFSFNFDVNCDGWYDDASDGPVSAVVTFDDGTATRAHGAWVVCADPAYAPQIRNVVSIWDEVYDTWVRELDLAPEICQRGRFQTGYEPPFEAHLLPVFTAAALTRWTTNLPSLAVRAHQAVGAISAGDDPGKTILAGLVFIRNPNREGETSTGVPLMPLSLGDSGKAFLSVTKTQYFFLSQWNDGKSTRGDVRLGPGEALDIASLANCLGGRFVPGIEMSYPVRERDMYDLEWRTSGAGPFRIKHRPLDYRKAKKGEPFLTGGWIPRHSGNTGLEPGDTSKFMAIPWQTDYNSCAVHESTINLPAGTKPPADYRTLFWSWPAQRPVAVYGAKDVVDGKLGRQVYFVRGPGTETTNLQSVSTFQDGMQTITGWARLGFVLQGSSIDGDQAFGAQVFLEAESQLDPPPVMPWPLRASGG